MVFNHKLVRRITMRQKAMQICLIFFILLLSAACSPSPLPVPTKSITISDSLCRSVVLPAPPERIIIAGKANFMINDAVYLFRQAPDRIIGLTQARQGTLQFTALLDADFEEKARFTLTSSVEEIAAAQPDLVLLKSLMQETLGNNLEQLDIPVVYLDLETPEQYKRDIAMLGQIFADQARADEIWAYYQTLLDMLREGIKDIPTSDRPSVLVVQYNSSGGTDAFQVPPATWIQTQMVELSGGTPVWKEAAEGNWAVVNFEQIAAWNPQQIYVLSYFENPETIINTLKADPKWQQLAVVQNAMLYGFPTDFYSWDQPDTRWSLGLTWLARNINAAHFPDLDISRAFYQFYGELYGLDTQTINQDIIPLVQGVNIAENTAE
ncbi:MAG: ABC transporter substrate-binding protein [Anaerolineales bacterium]|nr:MAG: ABC transporter substrate-binding protein [Anaerolineales bacterium]